MKKIALLIGVSEYTEGLSQLPKAVQDAEALEEVLKDPNIGEFDTVVVLKNPNKTQVEIELQNLFDPDHDKDDLILLFFSGHGIKDEAGKLYLATHITRKLRNGALNKATAVDVHVIHDIMSGCRSRRQVVILDCCFSGAFAEGLSLKDDGTINIKATLGSEGRAILTSSTSTQYSFEQTELNNSIYTHYLLEGIKTGAADLSGDGRLSIDELHQYTKRKVWEMSPKMNPEIYASKEGYNILLVKSPVVDPKLRYRKEVERYADKGKIPPAGRILLEDLRNQLNVYEVDAQGIEEEVFLPYCKYQASLKKYEVALIAELQEENPLRMESLNRLKSLQKFLSIRDEDVNTIEKQIYCAFSPEEYEELPSKQYTKTDRYDAEYKSKTQKIGLLVVFLGLLSAALYTLYHQTLIPIIAVGIKHGEDAQLPIPVIASTVETLLTETVVTDNEQPSVDFQDTLKDGGLGPKMIWISAGKFQMGDLQKTGNSDEQPVRWVEMKKFAIGKYEVTFEEYDRFAQATGREKPCDDGWGRGKRPVINVDWNDAVAYTKWLSKQTGRAYRLPTEVEWEYVARAGTETRYWWGNNIGSNRANCDGCSDDQWDANKMTVPVGSFACNAFQVCDTAGNVSEWTCSEYTDIYNGNEKECINESQDQDIGGRRVVRGGSWDSEPNKVRSAYRNWVNPTLHFYNRGLRVVRFYR